MCPNVLATQGAVPFHFPPCLLGKWAGHSTIGEAYLMGKGTPHTNSGEWSKICQLLAAPLPGNSTGRQHQLQCDAYPTCHAASAILWSPESGSQTSRTQLSSFILGWLIDALCNVQRGL